METNVDERIFACRKVLIFFFLVVLVVFVNNSVDLRKDLFDCVVELLIVVFSFVDDAVNTSTSSDQGDTILLR